MSFMHAEQSKIPILLNLRMRITQVWTKHKIFYLHLQCVKGINSDRALTSQSMLFDPRQEQREGPV